MRGFDRREFLAGVAALGARVVLPGDAPPGVVDREWERLQENPWEFEVDQNGKTLREVGGEIEIKCNADIWDSISPEHDFATSSFAVDMVDSTPALEGVIQPMAEEELERLLLRIEEVQSEIDELREVRELEEEPDELSEEEERELAVELVSLRKAAHALEEDPYGGWRVFLARADERRLSDVRTAVESWLQAEPDWWGSELWPDECSGQGRVLKFFRDGSGCEWCAELGVEVVEGEHPGSTYYAAELRVSIEEANRRAERMGLPIRFRAAQEPTC